MCLPMSFKNPSKLFLMSFLEWNMMITHWRCKVAFWCKLYLAHTIQTWESGPLLRMAGYSSLQGIGISLLKYRWCYESVQNYGTKLEQNVHTIGGLICG